MLHRFITLVLCLIAISVAAQQYTTKYYRIENGLPTDVIKAITQDSLGNLWIATDEGFVKYSGARFDTYRDVVHSNYTKGFLRTRNGRLLAIADLDLLELRKSGDSTSFRSLVPVSRSINDSSLSYPKSLYEDVRGTLWVSESQSVVKLTSHGIKRYHFELADRTPQFIRSFSFFEDGNRDLYTVSMAGNVFRYDPRNDRFDNTGVQFPHQIEFAEVVKGHLVIGGRDGLYLATPSREGTFGKPHLVLPVKMVSYVAVLPNGNYFVATRGSEHFLLDSAFTHSRVVLRDVENINHVYLSTENDIWLSTNEGIVFMQEAAFQGPVGKSDQFTDFIECITEDASSRVLYYATSKELHHFDLDTGVDKLIIDNIPDSYFQSLVSTKKGLWAANAFRVLLFNGSKIVKTFDFSDQRMFVTSLNKDSQENVWITIPGRKEILMIDSEMQLHSFSISLGENGFINMVKDGGDGIYAVSNGADYLFYKPYADSVFRNISIPVKLNPREDLNTYNLFVTGESIWLTTSVGLLEYNRKSIERVTLGGSYTVRSLYPNDGAGFLLATTKELLYYDVKNRDAHLFASSMNLSGLTVNSRSLLVARDKKVWIGTSKGVYSSNRRITDAIKTLQPRVAYANAGGKTIASVGQSVFPYGILLSMTLTSVTFPEEERIFEFRYSEQHPWRRLNGTTIDIVTSDPGLQQVQIRARKTGTYEWSDVTNVAFDVSRPFRMTPLFYALIIAAMMIIIILTVVIVKARGARQKLRLEAIVNERTAQLGEANRELEAFSYSVSHDLRAPLRSILGFSTILDQDFGPQLGEEGRRTVASVQRNAEKMNQLIEDLLRFSKILHQGLKKGSINLNEQVREVVASLRESGGEKTLVNIEPLPEVTADAGLLEQVWSNLISNAIKYSSKAANPRVNIGFTEESNEFIFHVRDNGAGFDMKYAEKLFGVFQRLHTDNDFPGIGIGLALVRRIVMRHGGRIWAEGKVNEGASFYFSLPK